MTTNRYIGGGGCSQQRQLWLVFLIMLYYSHQTVTVSAFGSYMLSRSGCFTELSTEEVIMNSKVYAAADSDDPTMQLRMIGQHHNAESELFDANVLRLAKQEQTNKDAAEVWRFPEKALKEPDNNVWPYKVSFHLSSALDSPLQNEDYQFVVDVSVISADGTELLMDEKNPFVYFTNGSCEGKRRVSGRHGVGKEKDEHVLVIEKEAAAAALAGTASRIHVWAGWSTGHERVRLTDKLAIILQDDVGEQKNVKQTEPVRNKAEEDPSKSFATYALSETGCYMIPKLSAAKEILGMPVQDTGRRVLDVASGTETIPAELALKWGEVPGGVDEDSVITSVILESSAGSKFVNGACSPGYQRVSLTEHEAADPSAWPKLIISEERDIFVWAIYSVMDTSSGSPKVVLKRTKRLELAWTPPENNKKDNEIEKKDPSKAWAAFMLNHNGCSDIPIVSAAEEVLGMPILKTDRRALEVASGTETIPSELTLKWEEKPGGVDEDGDITSVILETSVGSKFVFGACSGHQVSLTGQKATDPLTWPKLIISEERDIFVWAIYSVVSTSSGSPKIVLKQTKKLELAWTPLENNNKDTKKEKDNKNSQQGRQKMERIKKEEHRQKREQEQKQKKLKPIANKDDPQKLLGQELDFNKHLKQYRKQPKDPLVADLELERKARLAELMPGREALKSDGQKHGPQQKEAAILEKLEEMKKRRMPNVADSDPSRMLGQRQQLELPAISMTSYYMGVCFYVVLLVVAVQLCLVKSGSSARNKGRRDL